MPVIFSCTLWFSSSYFTNTCWNSFATRDIIWYSEKLRMISATRNTSDSRASIMRHMRIDNTSLNGALTLTPISCWKALCSEFTSVVMRVTRPAVEYLSMSEKASRCMLRYIAERRLAANPVEA